MNPRSFSIAIRACAMIGLHTFGRQIHAAVSKNGLGSNLPVVDSMLDVYCRRLQGNVALANALVDMYAKCGSISDSRKIFREMSERDLVSWTSMMIGYGAHGYGKEAVELFDEMVRFGIRPDRIVFVAVLTTCSHTGLIDEGLRWFESMSNYNVTPDQEIYGCVVDLLGRAGRAEEAYQLI
ncbi:hypothetical protein DITRI_Ditri06bG0176700 [Diplodiscus trichospermus]